MEARCPKSRLCWVLLEMAAFEEDSYMRLQEAFLGFFNTLAKCKDVGFVWDILNGPSQDIHLIYKEIQKGLRPKIYIKHKKRLGLTP
jgi:hypothetical protein